MVETALGRYSSGLVAEWSLPDGFDADEVSARVPDAPEVWSDGSLVLDSVAGISAAGAGLFAHQSEHCWCRWGHVDRVLLDRVPHSCRGFVSVPGPLQTVQRAELWVATLALQSSDAVHIGVDNLGVVRHVGRLLDDCSSSGPALSLPRLGDEAPLRGEQELYSQHALLYRFQQGGWKLKGKGKAKLLVLSGKVRFMLQEDKTMKILSNFVVQGPDPYCELKPNAGRDSTLVWKIPGTGGDPDKELALKFKGIFEGARMLNDAATAARGER